MKTYLINSMKQVSVNSQSCDTISTLKAQEWIVYNEDLSQVEKFLFIDDKKLLVSVNGKFSYSKWEYININSSLIIDDEINKYLLKIVICNKDIIVLNVDSTNDYSFLINSKSLVLRNPTYADIQWYLIRNCGIDILNEQQRNQFAEEKRLEEEKKRKEQQEKKLEQKKVFKGFVIVAGIVLAIFIAISSLISYNDYKKRHPTIYKTKEQNKIAVDLGLSVKWASCNVGANSPEEFGNYYGWGEPTGTDAYGYDSEPVRELNKRFPNREYDTPPPFSIINTSNDIAKQNWGGEWRMPTKAEAQELISKCKIVCYYSGNKKFVKVVGPNGNHIIFPSAGFVQGTNGNWILEYHEYSVYIYTGELYYDVSSYEYADNKASYIFIGDTYENMNPVRKKVIDMIDRYEMLPVRAVMNK